MRDKLKDLSKEYDKSENDLKALQSVGQVIIQDVYRVAQNFCGSLFLQIGDFCVLQELIFVIRTDRFFLLGINFGEFQKVCDQSLIVFRVYVLWKYIFSNNTMGGVPYLKPVFCCILFCFRTKETSCN